MSLMRKLLGLLLSYCFPLLQSFFAYFPALTKVYEKASSVVSYTVACPTWLHKYIIGKKGISIQKLTSELSKVQFFRRSYQLFNFP